MAVSFPVRGLQSLSDFDLLVRLVGPKRGPALASLLTEQGLASVANRQPEALVSLGLTPREAEIVSVSFELGRRAIPTPITMPPITTPQAAAAWFQPVLEGLAVEEFHALYLDRRLRPLRYVKHTRGSDAHTVVDCASVYRVAVELGAVAVVVGHNHPSGDPTPSPEDQMITRRLQAGLQTLGIRLNDHIIVGRGTFTSMAERGMV